MKTDSKSKRPERKGAPGGFRNNRRNDNHPQRKKRGSFFRAVPESEKKTQQHRPGGAGPSPVKRGHGVQKTTSFKPKQHNREHERRTNNSKNYHKSNRPYKGQQKGSKGPAPMPPKGASQLFQDKPEKVNYCLAPERLELQAQAIKLAEREEKEKMFEGRKEERNRKHKLMTLKTRKGQPVLHGRMEILLEKVKKTMGVL